MVADLLGGTAKLGIILPLVRMVVTNNAQTIGCKVLLDLIYFEDSQKMGRDSHTKTLGETEKRKKRMSLKLKMEHLN